MRHRKRTVKLGRTSSHRRALFANLLQSLIMKGRIVTTLAKAKELRRHADKMITLAKKGDEASMRLAKGRMMLRYNTVTTQKAKEGRIIRNRIEEQKASEKEQAVKENKPYKLYSDDKALHNNLYNEPRKVLDMLFNHLAPSFKDRNGGYTRIVKLGQRRGDGADTCMIEYITE